MARPTCDILKITGRRAVALLEYPEKDSVNVRKELRRLNATNRRQFRRLFDKWADGSRKKQEQYHEFGAPYERCFVFKSDNYRIYGFITHTELDKSFEYCCLTTHATKDKGRTDTAILDRVLGLADDHNVVFAIERSFEENRL